MSNKRAAQVGFRRDCSSRRRTLRDKGLEGMSTTAAALAKRGSPPSTYSALALVEGQPGAIWRFTGTFLGRCFFIAPGLALAGYRGKELITSSLAASGSISMVMLLFYGYLHAKAVSTSKPAPWENGWNAN